MKLVTLGTVLVASIVLAGCLAQSPKPGVQTDTTQGVTAPDAPAAEQKKGDTVITGMISQVGEKYFITVAGQTPKEIESYLVKLDEYVGKSVTITGQYSGDTLFVGKVE